jgi:DNA-binding CsgD family transcriptional regulator
LVARAGAAEVVERRAILDLVEALGSSLDLRLVLERVYPQLLRLVGADYGALGISPSGAPRDFEWQVAGLPPAFFAAYGQMAAHDFVRVAVLRRPNVVLRDQEMIGRRALERNLMYQRAREIGLPLEQVMAVMLHVDRGWQSGLSLYRDRRRPFSERERAIVQDVTPAFVNAVRNCQLFGGLQERATTLDALISEERGARLLVRPPATVVEQTPSVAGLLAKWFDLRERGKVAALPPKLATVLAAILRDPLSQVPSAWTSRDGHESLTVSFVPVPSCGQWLVMLRETRRAEALPAAWVKVLTRQQQHVTARVLRGWDNRLIANDLGCATATVKKHLQTVFDRLGVPSRTVLLVRAATELRGD